MTDIGRLVSAASMGLIVLVGTGCDLASRTPSETGAETTPPTAEPSAQSVQVFPSAGLLATGERHAVVTVEGVAFSLEVPSSSWISNGSFLIEGHPGSPDETEMFFWTGPYPSGVYADPCGGSPAAPAGPSAGDLAGAMAAVPGLEVVAEPSDVTVGGLPAKYVELRTPEDAECSAGSFFLWYFLDGGEEVPRYVTWLGSTIRAWIIEVDGVRVLIEAETRPGETAEIAPEILEIIDSIQFD
ncbi:MAG: hypothetical protein ACRDFZ_02580 [Candidatus Limnocylindria bacterium]